MSEQRVPIRNLYYLLCYAWDHLHALDDVPAEVLQSERPVDLLASVLVAGVARAQKRGLDRAYVTLEQETRSPRGKIELSATLKRSLLRNARVACSVDELSHDVPHNRILKAGLRLLLRDRTLSSSLERRARTQIARLQDVSDVELRPEVFNRVQLHRNNRHYGFLLEVCRLLMRCRLPRSDEYGGSAFRDFRGSDREMGELFEAFLRNFWRREQGLFRVSRQNVAWSAEGEEASRRLLPSMKTDIVLSEPGRRIIVECKVTKRPFQEHYGRRKLRSEHLYQLFAYLKNAAATDARFRSATGLLVYPTVHERMNVDLTLAGHQVLVRSVDLGRPWFSIRHELLGLVHQLSNAGGIHPSQVIRPWR